MANEKKLIEIIEKIRDFINGKIGGEEFSQYYLKHRRKRLEKTIEFSPRIEKILDRIFMDVDAFEPDPKLLRELREEFEASYHKESWYIDEEEFRKRAKIALNKLNKILKRQKASPKSETQI